MKLLQISLVFGSEQSRRELENLLAFLETSAFVMSSVLGGRSSLPSPGPGWAAGTAEDVSKLRGR